MGNKDATADPDWFALPVNDQRTLLRTGVGKRVPLIEKRVFLAFDKFIGDELGAAEKSNESESEAMEGEKYERSLKQKKKVTAAKKVGNSKRYLTRLSSEAHRKSSKSDL